MIEMATQKIEFCGLSFNTTNQDKEDLMSLKPLLNLCSRRPLKPDHNLFNNFIPTESLMLKVFL